ncbi:MAG: DUF1549 and DUF1553 domain-containing protein [Isosphaeraceae bacterium]
MAPRSRRESTCTLMARSLPVAIALVTMNAIPWSQTGRGGETGPALSVEPPTIRLEGRGSRQQLAVSLRSEDGSVRDVTARSRYALDQSAIATIDAGGVARPLADGQALLRVVFEGQTAEARVFVQRFDRARPIGFRTDVVPLFSKAGCNMGACHGNFNGKGGFRLSLRGEDPSFDLQALTRDQLGRRIDLIAAPESLIVRKPTGQIAHEGGIRFLHDSVEAETLIGWIAAGARGDRAEAHRVKSLRVFPGERVVAPGWVDQQLVVTAEFDDGATRDVTRLAACDASDPTRVEVSSNGLVHARRAGETTVAIRYMNGRAASRLAFLPDRPGFVWNGPQASHPIDKLAFAKLRALLLNPAPLAGAPVFVRRAHLDAIGRLPLPDETRAFLADPDPDKRARLIDRLVVRPEFADFWALKWADLLRNEEKTMGAKGAWVFQRWLRDQIAADRPMDEVARQIVAGLGSTWRNPPASFHRTNRDPMAAAESVSQVFLGIRLQCARCHNHPFDVWTQDDYYGLAAFFANIGRKEINNQRKDRLDSHEINGDEIIYTSGRARILQPRSGKLVEPRWLNETEPATQSPPGGSALDRLADRLTRNNRQFSRNLANRVWFHLFARGLVEPVDDFRDSNPPSNPALLESITGYFEAHGLRLAPLVAWIMKSQTYQLSATPDRTSALDEANFAQAAVRLLPAEVLLDAISQVLGVPEQFPNAPRSLRSTQLPGPAPGVAFLKTFGKPDRLLTCECERSDATTLAQAFQMINGETLRRKLERSDNRIGRALEDGASDADLLREVYLAALCREPTAAEQARMLAHARSSAARRKNWEDIVWAICNSKEFLLRH